MIGGRRGRRPGFLSLPPPALSLPSSHKKIHTLSLSCARPHTLLP
jgi:hypothetical protein